MNYIRIACLLIPLIPNSLFAQAGAKTVDPDPEIERKSFQLADGFEVNLFAGDPLLAKPIQMNFDSKGRLWVASSETYPQIKPGEKANDKIIILEDKDGDGRADTTTVFADGLLIPTGVEPGDGGAYVANSTELLHMSASKPGGKADRSRVVLSGFGTEDTHHILHTFRWGPDGCLYFNQSIYIHSHLETPHGVKRLNGGGIWRFRPENMNLDVFVRGFVNTWGHHIDQYGQSFITDGAYGEGINHGVPGAYYFTAVGATRILSGLNPGSPKHCGLEIVNGRHLPDDWQNNMITNDFRGHRVCRFKLREDGSTYSSQEMPELIKTSHPAFRPIDVKMGPDGAIYIADWYNPIIQHGEIDFRDPRRDHTHGRIWRITAKNRPLVGKPKLADATVDSLLAALGEPENWTRQHAKRMLKERGAAEVIPSLQAYVSKLTGTDEQTEKKKLEAMWVYQGFYQYNRELLDSLLAAKTPQIRAAAVRIMGDFLEQVDQPLAKLQVAVRDPHPRVRMEAVCLLRRLTDPKAVEVALQALDQPMDKVLDYALWQTVRELEAIWLPKFQAGELSFNNQIRHLTFVIESAASPQVMQPLTKLLQTGKIDPKQVDSAWAIVARRGTPNELQIALNLAADPKTSPNLRVALLTGLFESQQQRNQRPTQTNTLTSLLKNSDERVQQLSYRLIGAWKVASLRSELIQAVESNALKGATLEIAVDSLTKLGGADLTKLMKNWSTASSTDLRRATIVAWAGIDLKQASIAMAGFLETATPSNELTQALMSLIKRKGGPEALTAALQNRSIPNAVAVNGVAVVRSSGQEFPALVEAFNKAGKVAGSKKDYSPSDIQQLVADTTKLGDAARGELIFRRKELNCFTCHAIGSAGGRVGPELGSIGGSAPLDYLVESLLIPNKAVKEGYHAINVTTVEGKVFTGIKVQETKTNIVLRNAEDQEINLRIDQIEDRANSRSLMPDGLTDALPRQEFLDLVRFLSELGKLGPYSMSKAKLVRRWETLEPTPESGKALRENRIGLATINDPRLRWQTVYSLVSGQLRQEDLPKFRIFGPNDNLHVVRATIETTTAGPVKLKLNSPTGLQVWLGDKPVEVQEEIPVTLPVGLTRITIAINKDERKDGLTVELVEPANSPARASIINGK
jgi:putative heme-binding domain-containing protein